MSGMTGSVSVRKWTSSAKVQPLVADGSDVRPMAKRDVIRIGADVAAEPY